MSTQLHMDVPVMNLLDVLDAAILIEKEAEERYWLFSEQLERHERGDAAEFFSRMAKNEHKHGAKLAQKRRECFGATPTRLTASRLEPDIEAPELELYSRFMSPRNALDVALASEAKAYAYYDRLMGESFAQEDAAICNLLKSLRDEEAEHQRLLTAMKARYPETQAADRTPEFSKVSAR